MKIQVRPSKHTRGFTLIEMIGVLAVIAILAALLVPKIFEAINNARVNNAAVSYNTAKTALADHYAKFGTMLSSNGTPIVAGVGESTNFDKVLVAEAFMDKPFIVKIGDGTGNRVEIIPAVTAATAVTAANAAFDLDGSGVAVNDAPGSVVVWAVIEGVAAGDAKDLNDRIDGPTLGVNTGADLKGRVKYADPAGGTTTVYMYLSHR
ncbi:MAG TPA: prepilin-type N-terminal cleavage/methylation domain-containing protein [Candidatus Saccharimonadales bacterium]|jgi:prepilin-type N-terminal cleavage/methylation domain-containing protein|nr:prepilin-type N-terminal cleavage/methylation domain-containing protein [Candidatus Saccharimonadales bacterium]